MSVSRRKKKRGGKRTLTLENDDVVVNDGYVFFVCQLHLTVLLSHTDNDSYTTPILRHTIPVAVRLNRFSKPPSSFIPLQIVDQIAQVDD